GNTTTIDAIEFLRRFLLHVLLVGFVKIRHYGLVAAANATTKLEVARSLPARPTRIAPASPSHIDPPPTWRELLLALTGIDLLVCPACRTRSMERHPLPRWRPPDYFMSTAPELRALSARR